MYTLVLDYPGYTKYIYCGDDEELQYEKMEAAKRLDLINLEVVTLSADRVH